MINVIISFKPVSGFVYLLFLIWWPHKMKYCLILAWCQRSTWPKINLCSLNNIVVWCDALCLLSYMTVSKRLSHSAISCLNKATHLFLYQFTDSCFYVTCSSKKDIICLLFVFHYMLLCRKVKTIVVHLS